MEEAILFLGLQTFIYSLPPEDTARDVTSIQVQNLTFPEPFQDEHLNRIVSSGALYSGDGTLLVSGFQLVLMGGMLV